MRASLVRAFISAFVAAAGGLTFSDASHAQVTSAPTFNKQAVDASGAPLTGPVSVGQTIQYVLSYSTGTTLPTGTVSIDDTLSANLAYVNASIVAPPGWSWTLPGYSPGNHEVYSHPGFGPGTSFIINVPVSDRALVGQTGGDGTIPIPVGNNVYGIQHHLDAGSATIMCWQLSSLAKCAGTWPRSIGSDLMTPTVVRHAVVGSKIYYPTARVAGSGATATTTPGIGCWDTVPDAPCAFTPLPGGPAWVGIPPVASNFGLDPLLGGIAADPSLARLFMYAVNSSSTPTNGQVYCVPLSVGACAGWSSVPTLTAGGNSFTDMILEETAGGPATRLYVAHSTKITCLSLTTNGALCAPNWLNVATTVPRGLTLSPVLNPSGAMIRVCLHPFPNGLPACVDTATGAPVTLTGALAAAMGSMSGKYVFAAYRVPGTVRVLYPNGVPSNATSPLCFDFSTGMVCAPPAPFVPAWATSNNFKDYGYAVDPAEPDRCLLGLGDAGFVWRFARDGGFDANGCVKRVEATFDINSFFCAIKPKEPTWGSVVIKNRPTQLTGGTINLVGGSGPIIPPITVGAANSYPVNIPATGANSQLTLQFSPTYTPGPPPNGYQLELTFKADVDPQICYRATVTACGPVFNKASMAGFLVGPAAPVPFNASDSVELGNATGAMCVSEGAGLLKVCKVAGPGIAIGTPFTFTAGPGKFAVPAGPAPGGTCMIGPTFPVGSNVTVDEDVPPGHTVSSITVLPPKQLVGTPNLAAGSVNVTIGTGVTVVTFTDKLTGFLEICKRGDVTGNFSFTVSPGGLGPFIVPAGACSPPIEVIAGPVVVTEQPTAGIAMIGCATFPAGQQGACDPNAQTSTVTVAAGDVSAETIAFITNRKK